MHTAIRKDVEAFMYVAAPPETVFPLLCPVREYDWIDSWQGTLLYSATGFAEPGCVFQTELPAAEGDAGTPATNVSNATDTWVVCRYEPNEAIAFVRCNGDRTTLYSIRIRRDGEGSRLHWRQQYTGLNATGNAMVEESTQQQFSDLIQGLELMLNHYCATGTCLPQPEVARMLGRTS